MPFLRGRLLAVAAGGPLLLGACSSAASSPAETATPAPAGTAGAPDAAPEGTAEETKSPITLAFAGDTHFEGGLATLPFEPGSTLGPMSRVLRSADVAMLNLESALTVRGTPSPKEKEDPDNRYWFSAPAAALDVLDRSGVDVVTVANNHGADYGVVGVRDTLRAAARSRVGVVGIGRDVEEAYQPHRISVRGTDVAVLAADASPRESADPVWAVGPGSGPGLATARLPHVRPLVGAVQEADRRDDLVVVYLHWGREYDTCPTPAQRELAGVLTDAGADVVVGTHAHELQGAGTTNGAYVSYGLGNFFWYHGIRSETGVLQLTVSGGEVVGEQWVPGTIPIGGGAPRALTGADRADALADWEQLRGCTDLAPGPGPAAAGDEGAGDEGAGDEGAGDEGAGDGDGPTGRSPGDALPPFASTVQRIGPAMRARMSSSHDAATCPVPLSDLRWLTLRHVGFDDRAYDGTMVVHEDVADDVVTAFAALYRARFPVERMRLVDVYGGDDDRSMAANNTSGYNCRRVAGTTTFSDHAYGRAIDINPVQNPYVLGGTVLPAAGRPFVAVDRSPGVRTAPGVIGEDDVVTRTFARLGWGWGGDFSDPDFQHFSSDGG